MLKWIPLFTDACWALSVLLLLLPLNVPADKSKSRSAMQYELLRLHPLLVDVFGHSAREKAVSTGIELLSDMHSKHQSHSETAPIATANFALSFKTSGMSCNK